MVVRLFITIMLFSNLCWAQTIRTPDRKPEVPLLQSLASDNSPLQQGLSLLEEPSRLPVNSASNCSSASVPPPDPNFNSCDNVADASRIDIHRSSLSSEQKRFCGIGQSGSPWLPGVVDRFVANDLKRAFNCHLAFEVNRNLESLRTQKRCFEANNTELSCQSLRRSMYLENERAYNQAISALVRSEPFVDHDSYGKSTFSLESLMTSGITDGVSGPVVRITRSPEERIRSLMDDRVAPRAGLGSLSFGEANLDSFLEGFGGDIRMIGGFQSIPRLPSDFIEQERDDLVSYVSTMLSLCRIPGRNPEANSMRELSPEFMRRAEACEKETLGPMLELRQKQAQTEYSQLVASHPLIAYLDLRDSDQFTFNPLIPQSTRENNRCSRAKGNLPLLLSNDDECSRNLMKRALEQVEANTEKFRDLLLSNQVDYDTESALLPAMNEFLGLPGNSQYCKDARQISNLRPVANISNKIKNFVVRMLGTSACYSAATAINPSNAANPGTGLACSAIVESTNVAFEAQRSLRLSQTLTSLTNDRVAEGITDSDV